MPGKRAYSSVHPKDSLPRKRRRSAASDDEAALKLAEFLDFTSVDTEADILQRFEQIGHSLLRKHRLCLTSEGKTTEFDILELEFYLRKEGHEDPFTHGSEEQRFAGQWYFHRAPRRSADSNLSLTSATGYRGGTRKGLDLTLGGSIPSPHFPTSTTSYLRGGILLRSVRRISDAKVISGPSLLVDEILRLSGSQNIAELVRDKWQLDMAAFPSSNPSGLARKARLVVKAYEAGPLEPESPIYRSPRIGLDLSHPGTTPLLTHPRVIYVARPYRYFTRPTLLTANGRPQTFLGVRGALVKSGAFAESEHAGCEELSRLTGINLAAVRRYLADFQNGAQNGQLQMFVGPAGKGASASPATYLKMMGTIMK